MLQAPFLLCQSVFVVPLVFINFFYSRVGVSTRTFGKFSFEDLFITNCLSIDAVKFLDFSSKFKFRLAELKTPLVCLLKVDIGVDAACRRVFETCKLIGEEILVARAGEGEDGIGDVEKGEDNQGEGVGRRYWLLRKIRRR